MGRIIDFIKGLDRAADATFGGFCGVIGAFLWGLLYLVKWGAFVLFWGCIWWLGYSIVAAAVC